MRWLCSFLSNRPQCVKIGNVLSNVVISNGGIPQGTKTAPLLFAILVNRLVSSWPNQLKYVDDTTVFEIIPRCSPSYLQFIVNEIEDFASLRGMRLNPKKCKELQVNFLNYQPGPPRGLVLGSTSISQVDSYKLLGVYISSDLSWNIHIDYIVKKASKRLYALRVLARAGVSQTDLVLFYCSLIRSVLEYAAPVWACLPEYLNELVESVQRRALRIIFPRLDYGSALGEARLQPLAVRRAELCSRFMSRAQETEPLSYIVPRGTEVHHSYFLRTGNSRLDRFRGATNRFNNFVTVRYQ